jgi:hypothetical protein
MTNDEFERAVLEALTAGTHPTLAILREQVASAVIAKREVTDTGFFVYYDVPPEVPRITPRELDLGDLQVILEGAETPADAVIHVRDGAIDSLECYVYEGDWPDEPTITGALYYGTETFDGIGPELFGARNIDDAFEE